MKIPYFYLLQDEKHILVGGSNHLEKYESMGRIIPYIMETCQLFQTTSQYYIV